MNTNPVGVRFAPTEEELITFYLKNKNLGLTYLVVDGINDINILSREPWFLPSFAKLDSGDLAWYFFSPIVYADSKKKNKQRTLASGNGYWKSSGQDRPIKGKRMSKGEIGIKKTFSYYEKDNKVPTSWTMHEYHITCLSQLSPELSNYVEIKYVICKVMYNGEDEDITSGGNNQNDQSQSFVSSDTSSNMRPINTRPGLEQQGQENFGDLFVDELMYPVDGQEHVSPLDVLDPNKFTENNYYNNASVQPEASHLAPNDDEFLRDLRHVDIGQVEHLFSDEDFIENCNHYIPKQPLSGVIVDYSSDSDDEDDAESISELSYQGASSPDSVHNSNRHFLHTSGDDTSIKKTEIQVKQDRTRVVGTSMQKKTSMVKTKKNSSGFIAEEAMETNHKNPRSIYLMCTMISFGLLLWLHYIGFKMKFD